MSYIQGVSEDHMRVERSQRVITSGLWDVSPFVT